MLCPHALVSVANEREVRTSVVFTWNCSVRAGVDFVLIGVAGWKSPARRIGLPDPSWSSATRASVSIGPSIAMLTNTSLHVNAIMRSTRAQLQRDWIRGLSWSCPSAARSFTLGAPRAGDHGQPALA